MTRRDVTKTGIAAAGAVVLGAVGAGARPARRGVTLPSEGKLRKACLYSMLPENLSPVDRMRLAKRCGFEGLEVPPVGEAEAREMRSAADAAGIALHSIIYGGWDAPLSSADAATIQRGQRQVEQALRSAKIMGCENILLVPAVVDAKTSYADAYTRSQRNIRPLIPLAERLRVMILIEEVWNNFLLSPLEFARYVDEFRSPWVQAYFDVGNVVKFAWPEQWIRVLGKRIKKVHLKDFRRGNNEFTQLGDGDVDWAEVRRAFNEVGWAGYETTELGGGDEAYLRDVSNRVDRIFAGTLA
jgi:L-ribulose-5-phosphate 3-epimerase